MEPVFLRKSSYRNEQIYAHRELHLNVIYYIKVYLFCLLVFIHGVTFIDGEGQPPYLPIELSSLLMTHYTRKAIFLACLTPVTLLLCFAKPMRWSLSGTGIGLFFMILFDNDNEWFLHLIGVMIFALALLSNINLHNNKNRHLLLVILLYLSRNAIKLFYVWQYELHYNYTITGRINVIAALGCNGYTQCLEPLITPYVFAFSALLEWALFILLAHVINE